jgi:hypothetical protein
MVMNGYPFGEALKALKASPQRTQRIVTEAHRGKAKEGFKPLGFFVFPLWYSPIILCVLCG